MALISALGCSAANYFIGDGSYIDAEGVAVTDDGATNSLSDYVKNPGNVPWGSVVRYSGDKAYFTNSVWAALSEAVDGDTIVYNGNFTEQYQKMAEAGNYNTNCMTQATNNLTIIGYPDSLITVDVPSGSNIWKTTGINLAGSKNLTIVGMRLLTTHKENDAFRTYNNWFNNVQNGRFIDCTWQMEVYGANNIAKNFIATDGQTNILVQNCNIISIDITGSNQLDHSASHGGEPILFKDCRFISSPDSNGSIPYAVGTTYFEGCYGDQKASNMLPLGYQLSKKLLLGTPAHTDMLDDIIYNIGVYNNLSDRKYLNGKSFQIARSFKDIEGICANRFSKVPTDKDITVYVYGDDYTAYGYQFGPLVGLNDVDITYIGIGSPTTVNYAQWVRDIRSCTNCNFTFKTINFKTVSNYRYWVLGMEGCSNVTVTADNCNFNLVSSHERANSIAGKTSSVDCKGVVNGGSITVYTNWTWNSYGANYNNVDVYTNNSDGPIGTLVNNKLVDLTALSTIEYVDSAVANATDLTTVSNQFLLKSGGKMDGILDMGGNKITNLANGVSANDAVNLEQVQSLVNITNQPALPLPITATDMLVVNRNGTNYQASRALTITPQGRHIYPTNTWACPGGGFYYIHNTSSPVVITIPEATLARINEPFKFIKTLADGEDGQDYPVHIIAGGTSLIGGSKTQTIYKVDQGFEVKNAYDSRYAIQSYAIVQNSTDPELNETAETFTTGSGVVAINFTRSTTIDDTMNNLFSTAAGSTLHNLDDSEGNPTPFDIIIEKQFRSSGVGGGYLGTNAHSEEANSGYFISQLDLAGSETGMIMFADLDDNKTYVIRTFASRESYSARTTKFVCYGSVTNAIEFDCAHNVDTYQYFTNTPINGIIRLAVMGTGYTTYTKLGYINWAELYYPVEHIYLKADGTDPMKGDLDMDGYNINNIGEINEISYIDTIEEIDYMEMIYGIGGIDYIDSIGGIDYIETLNEIDSNISMENHVISNLANGVNANDAVNKSQLDEYTNTSSDRFIALTNALKQAGVF